MIQKEREFFAKMYYQQNEEETSENVLFQTYFCLNNPKDHDLFR
jgi:hypothetical protein